MYYENFERLCKERNVTAYKVAKGTGVSNTTLSEWKRGLITPKTSKLEKIAHFFNVPISYITGAEEDIEKNKDALLEQAFSQRPIMKELFILLQDAPNEDIEFVIAKLKKIRGI